MTTAEIIDSPSPRPSLAEAWPVWAKIGLLSFGGPTAQIALMHRILVEEKKWLSEKQYLGALSFCMLLPGPEAMQIATYAGWLQHGVRGGLVAGLWFIAPGALVVLTLSAFYAAFGRAALVEALFTGVQAAVVVIVIEALLRIARRALKGPADWGLAAASFIALFAFAFPYPLVVLVAGAIGFWRAGSAQSAAPEAGAEPPRFSVGETAATAGLWLALWLAPLLALEALVGGVLSELGWFFSKLAVVTFGGAYAVLAYMGQDVVTAFGWLEAEQMMDGLGLAETTPGPLILVTEFVGFLAAFQASGGASWPMALAGAATALWATFVPCFLWIFVGAPYIAWINAQPRLRGALGGVTAAVVGVIAHLAAWFALHVFFADVALLTAGPLAIWTPDPGSLQFAPLLITLVCGYLLLWRHWPILAVLPVAALFGWLCSVAPPLAGA